MAAKTTQAREADQTYGALTEGVHLAGYSLERALQKLEWLLTDDRWRSVGDGFDDVNAFLDSFKPEKDFRIAAERRKQIATRIKELQPKASNRKIAKVLGADEGTIRNDFASENSASAPKKTHRNKAPATLSAENSAPRSEKASDISEASPVAGENLPLAPSSTVSGTTAAALIDPAVIATSDRAEAEQPQGAVISSGDLCSWATRRFRSDVKKTMRQIKREIDPRLWPELTPRLHEELDSLLLEEIVALKETVAP